MNQGGSEHGHGVMSAASPVPQVEITPTLAPGKRGPNGTAPRTNYSRVNTGLPPVADVGGGEQKTMAPRGAEMLPKIAGSEVSMGQIAVRPTVNDMIKAAQAGALAANAISQEGARQAENMGDEPATKTAVAAPVITSFEEAEKLAAALDFMADELTKEAANLGGAYTLKAEKTGPGTGPGTLGVLQATADGKQPFKPGNQGKAHTTVPTQSSEQKTTSAGPSTQLSNTMNSPAGFHGHQQTSMVNQKGTKTAAADEGKKCPKCDKPMEKCSCDGKMAGVDIGLIRKLAGAKTAGEDATLEKKETEGMEAAKKGLEKAEQAHSKEDKEKEAADAAGWGALAEAFGATQEKRAEDAINPAHISAGAQTPPDTRESGQSGGVPPAGGQTSLISSNESARNFTRGSAKSVPKADLKAYVNEPAQSSATDKTLSMAFAHTGEAGAKIASAPASKSKTAAARALFASLAAVAAEKGQ